MSLICLTHKILFIHTLQEKKTFLKKITCYLKSFSCHIDQNEGETEITYFIRMIFTEIHMSNIDGSKLLILRHSTERIVNFFQFDFLLRQ